MDIPIKPKKMMNKNWITISIWPYVLSNLNKFTHHLINEEIIKNAKKGIYIINVARGPVVKTDALLNMKEHIGGIGLDVFETEPLPQSSPLYGFENRIFGTHNGSHTIEGVDRVSLKVLDFIKDFFSN